ncbi:mechanosensitive ion channel family protein [Citricoccus sp. SGAir0253]|uniref:mechanosensitive ion channel family protein n=1 Tax=Citricoccus sp. SGAir0253 TaxID=2567881 RepID=UPI00143CD1F9|nr:mechanosensitive ion channel family protein [Citricoccus sp. SGAir0253]
MPSLFPSSVLPAVPPADPSAADAAEPAAAPVAAGSEQTAVPQDITGTVPDTVQEGAQGAVDSLGPFWGILSTVALGVGIALAVVVAGALVLNTLLARRPLIRQQVARCRIPVAVALSLMASRVALGLTASGYDWFEGTNFLLLAGIIGALAWLALRIVRIVEERLLAKYGTAGEDDRRDRKIQTQTVLIRRILQAVIIVMAVAAILLTIPQVRAVGAGLLASAGLVSVVAGLAVQSTLTNVFAGVQLAFTDAIRVGDVVTMEDVYGTIEDITLSYVVVKIWDGRRVIFPSSHFTTTPFENWTRVGSELSGTVEMEVDWRVPMDATRERLKALLESTELWDGKEGSVQVTDALGGMAKIRAVVSARNSGDLWDLRCLVREDLMTFLREEHPEAIFHQRLAEGVTVVTPAYEDEAGAEADGGAPAGGPGTSGRLPGGPDAGPVPGAAAGPRTGWDAEEAAHDAAAAGSGNGVGRAAGNGTGNGAGHAHPARPGRTAETDPRTGPVHPREPGPSTSPLRRIGGHHGPATAQQPAVTGGQRVVTGSGPAVTGSTPLTRASGDSSVFTGSITAIERNREFAGPGEKAYQERKEKAAQAEAGSGDHGDHGSHAAETDPERRARPDVDLEGD